MSQIKSMYPNLKQNITKTSSGSELCSYTSDLGKDTPILTLIHGYPQSAFEWRHMVPLLKDKVSLFVPELPGYGVSTPIEDNSKRGVGNTLLEAMQTVFNISESSPRKVIIGGHDRGARICHRLVVDKDRHPSLNIIGTVLMDIVPTKAEWAAYYNPRIAKTYFHWPMLANVEFSTQIIKAFGGANWCRGAHTRIKGPNEEGFKRMEADGAIDVYCELFSREDVLRYSAKDYEAGAGVDVDEQDEDQEAGRKVEVPILVLFSESGLGKRHDVEKVWRDWIKPEVPYKAIAIGNGHGHYLPEEAYDIVTDHVVSFLTQLK